MPRCNYWRASRKEHDESDLLHLLQEDAVGCWVNRDFNCHLQDLLLFTFVAEARRNFPRTGKSHAVEDERCFSNLFGSWDFLLFCSNLLAACELTGPDWHSSIHELLSWLQTIEKPFWIVASTRAIDIGRMSMGPTKVPNNFHCGHGNIEKANHFLVTGWFLDP